MNRRFFLCILIVLLSLLFVSATEFPNKYMEFGKSVVVNGKNVTFVTSGTGGNFVFEVDGIRKVIYSGRDLNGVKIVVSNIFVDAVMVNLTVNFECGDGKCESVENSEVCCMDCNCTEGTACVSNICKKPECSFDLECKDIDNCTVDKCEKNFCKYATIVECRSNDSCCPEGCPYSKDKDCKVAVECEKDENCKKEENPCVTGYCNNTKCFYKEAEGCPFNSICLKVEETRGVYYCSKEGLKEKKQLNLICGGNFECLSSLCVNSICVEKVEAEVKKSKIKEFEDVIIINLVVAALAAAFFIYESYRKKIEHS